MSRYLSFSVFNKPTMDNETNAAIAMALYEAFGYTAHDAESGKLTIEKKESLWSSNIQLMARNTK